MGNDEFLKIAVEEVRRYTKEHLEDPQDFDIYVVWVCKTLQNNKALLSTIRTDLRQNTGRQKSDTTS